MSEYSDMDINFMPFGPFHRVSLYAKMSVLLEYSTNLLGQCLNGRHYSPSVLPLQALRPNDDDRVLGRCQLFEKGVLAGDEVVDDVGRLAEVLVVVG